MQPKDIVRRFVDEYQTGGSETAFAECLDANVIDHSLPPGSPRAPWACISSSMVSEPRSRTSRPPSWTRSPRTTGW